MLEDEYFLITKISWILPLWMQPRFVRVSYLRYFYRWLRSRNSNYRVANSYLAMKVMCEEENLNIRPR